MEVGKKYIGVYTGRVYCCIAKASDGRPVIENMNSGNVSAITNTTNYKEYKEPRKGEVWVNIYENGIGGGGHFSKEIADHASNKMNRIACVKVEWTEGEGL